MSLEQYRGPASDLLKRLSTTPRPDGTPFTNYCNIDRSEDGLNWQATLRLPGRHAPVIVGQHKQQVVAACMADDAARAAVQAGLKQQPELNFDDVTRQMALQYIGVRTPSVLEVPAPDIPPGALDALRHGTKRTQPGGENKSAPAAGAPTADLDSNVSTGPPSKRHHGDKEATAAYQHASTSGQPPQALLQLADHSLRHNDGQPSQSRYSFKLVQLPPPYKATAQGVLGSLSPAAASVTHEGSKQPLPMIPSAPNAAAMIAATVSAQDAQHAAIQPGCAGTTALELLCQQGQQQSQACSSKSVQLAACAENQESSSADDSTPHAHESGLEVDPGSCFNQCTKKQIDGCWMQAGQQVWLMGKACKRCPDGSNSSSNYTQHELLLRVGDLRGIGATGEVYDVLILQHTSAAGDATGAATAAGPLVGQQLCLKVCRQYGQVPHELRDGLYPDAASYFTAMEASMEQHHTIMSAVGEYAGSIISSHMFGSISIDGANLPALLMDRAGNSLDIKLQQRSSRRPGVRGLGKQVTHTVMQQVLGALCDIHDLGWAYLDIKPANIVSSTIRDRTNPDDQPEVQHALVDFGSAQYLKAAGGRIRSAVPGTPEYMSPEHYNTVAGTSDVTYKADIWAMGILLIELRMGRAPSSEVLDRLRRRESLRPGWHEAVLESMKQSRRYRTITEREWAFIARCLAFEWEQRPTAAQLYEDDYMRLGPS